MPNLAQRAAPEPQSQAVSLPTLCQNQLTISGPPAVLDCRPQWPEFADGPMLMAKEPFMQVSRADFAGVLLRRAQHLLEEIAGERGAEAEAIHTAMHWAPAVVAGNITEAELVGRLEGIVSPELMCAAVANYREILCSVARRWAGAIANGYATEVTIVEELGIPADIVQAAVTEQKTASGRMALAKAAEEAEKAAWTFRSVVDRK